MPFITRPRDIPYQLLIELKDGSTREDVFYDRAEALNAKRMHAAQGIVAKLVELDD